MKRLGVGLVGSGFMGRCHAFAYRAVDGVFRTPFKIDLEILADIDAATAVRAATELGFKRSTGDWRELVADPNVDVVSVATPNELHEPIALAAIQHGKAVWCEKPLTTSIGGAKRMADAAEKAGVTTIVGFNYLKNPTLALAKEIITSGEIGAVISFRGIHAEEYMADPLTPFSWKHQGGGGGAMADIGSHIISMARYLVGDIVEVCGQADTVTKTRPAARGASEMRTVEVDDQAHFIARFANGASGSIHATWAAPGRNMLLGFELFASKGSLAFNQERMSELELYTVGQPKGRQGFKTIFAGPEHPHYAPFCPAPAHHVGFNDMKTIEAKALLDAIASGKPAYPDFRQGLEVMRVVEAVAQSSKTRGWVRIADI